MCISPDHFGESGDKLSQRSLTELLDATANKPALASSRAKPLFARVIHDSGIVLRNSMSSRSPLPRISA